MRFSKHNLKKLIPYPIRLILKRLVSVSQTIKKWDRADPLKWPLPGSEGKQGLEKHEYTLFSQNGEDGILRHLFAEIGFRSKLFLEFGFGLTENNSLRLMLKEGCGGLFIDGSAATVRNFNRAAQKLGIAGAKALCRFLTLENLEVTIRESGLSKEIDLLSIDVDGNDYWFWEKISSLAPRIVVIEYNASWGPDLAVTIPYDPAFKLYKYHRSGFYYGASLRALEILGQKKGYALVGCDSNGINAFFVRADCLTPNLEVLTAESAYRAKSKCAVSPAEQFRIIRDFPNISIE